LARDLPGLGQTVPAWDDGSRKDEGAMEPMGNDIDVHLGKRLRRRRRLLGLTQQQLAGACGVRFQQIQKYECGANRISAARLWQLSEALEVPVGYFYDGLSDAQREQASTDGEAGGEMFARKETLDLIRAYYQLGERPRRRLLDLAKSLNGDNEAA
jgi:transcriptional regulator with XRE-family HTH domain